MTLDLLLIPAADGVDRRWAQYDLPLVLRVLLNRQATVFNLVLGCLRSVTLSFKQIELLSG